MISHAHKTVFVHIPKAAGQSIEWLFLNDLGLDWDSRGGLLLRPKESGEPGPERLAHLRAKDYVELGYIDQATFDAYFSFGFVRNPYRRIYSIYRFLGYARIMSPGHFVHEVVPAKVAEDDFFFRTQTDYLYNTDGNLLVDFVGRLEHIAGDIQTVRERAGIKGELPHVNRSKGEWNRALGLLLRNPKYLAQLQFGGHSRPYEKSMDAALKKTIFDLYREDFDNFGYKAAF